jgi:UDP-2,3-diacylglucosamine hydrolase
VKAVFISDAHLKKSSDERYIKLIDFFNDLKAGKISSLVHGEDKYSKPVFIDDLFIAGDLFDFWFCRKDNIYSEFKIIINKLVELKNAGIRIHLFEGNHDFFMKEYFQDVLGIDVFEDSADFMLGEKNIYVSHGDTADKNNKVYMIFRKILRSGAFYHFQRFIPAPVLWAVADLSSATSKELNKDNGEELFERMSEYAQEKLHGDYDVIILGHSHQAEVKKYIIEGEEKIFVALGDWIKHYSFLYYENGEFHLAHYR